MTMPNAKALPRVHPLGRTLSLLLAVPLALLLLIHPGLMLDASGYYSHPLLMAVMLGVSAGLVHGVGFVPRLWLWRLLFGPAVGWPLLVLGYVLLVKAHLG